MSKEYYLKKWNKLDNQIYASATHDPGCRDLFGNYAERRTKMGGEVAPNLSTKPNNGVIVSPDPEHYPATDHLVVIEGHWKLEDQKRNFCLIIEDMEYGYEKYIRHCIPSVKKLIAKFRELNLPIVWTNWARRSDDGCEGALDRFYGPQGITNETNPCYIYSDKGIDTVAELAPINEEEMSRSIRSIHLSKFADLDEYGREIFFNLFEAWGTNTIIIVGAWTEECLAATVFDAIDKYGYDIILCPDGCATATDNGDPMIKCLSAACANMYSTDELIDYINKNPDKIEKPKAPLHGDVRHQKTKYKHDPVLEENEKLKQQVAELENEIAEFVADASG